MSDRRAVLVTRAEAEAATTAARLQAIGFIPVLAPLLTIQGRAMRVPGGIDGVIVTSGNAVAALAALGRDTDLLAVGDATAGRLRAAGFARAESAHGDAADLLALAIARCRPGASLLLATGAGQGHALAAALRGAGFRVHRRVAYAARPVTRFPDAARHAFADGTLRAAMFLSAETARAFNDLLPADLLGALPGVDALAIGPAAAQHLSLLPWRRVRVSVAPTLDQVLALL